MSPLVDIIIPTWHRADRLQRVVADAHIGTPEPHLVTLVVEHDDEPSVAAAEAVESTDDRVRVVVNSRAQNYAGAINAAVLSSDAPTWFAAADDVHFHPGWFTTARALIDAQFLVIGTNDLLNPFVLDGLHATHYLVDRSYTDFYGGTIDQGPGIALHEGTTHDYTDTEFIGVAKARVRFRPCLDAVVEHLHWTIGKAQRDETYERGLSMVGPDRAVYLERKKLWDNLVL